MNLLFLTQGESLSLFQELGELLVSEKAVDQQAFYVTDQVNFEQFADRHANFENDTTPLLKEWEIIKEGRKRKANLERLKKYEAQYGQPFLWNALIGDRRIYLGPHAAIEQDYKPRFTHEEMLGILEYGLEQMEKLFEQFKPDLVVSFICVTLGEYLAYLVAKEKGISFVNLRPTRVQNYFYRAEAVTEPSAILKKDFTKFYEHGVPKDLREKAQTYLKEVEEKHAMYEGVLPPPGKYKSEVGKVEKAKKRSPWETLKELYKKDKLFKEKGYYQDNHQVNVWYRAFFQKFKKPFLLKQVSKYLSSRYTSLEDLENERFAFYPLHKEPEVTLLVYSKAFLNQIEVIRLLAGSLPVGMKLAVKEHPGCLGYRPVEYYKKLLQIPGVVILKPEVTSRDILEKTDLVAAISGGIGFEAVLRKKPALLFGCAPFMVLPESMIAKAGDLNQLPQVVQKLLTEYQYDEEAIVAYLSAIINRSVPVHFYSRLLGRKGVFGAGNDAAEEEKRRQEDLRKLAFFIMEEVAHHGE